MNVAFSLKLHNYLCGGIDILVSNAAVNPFFGNIMDSTEDVWDKILSVNVKSAFLLTKLVVPHMEKRGGGNVIFVSSVAALGPYSVSKTALLGLTKALAPELAQSNIRVNCVAPGIIKTRFSSTSWMSSKSSSALKGDVQFEHFYAKAAERV
uniref:Dehydrogenase/reductase (SDR family) member 4 n=1 Tax=Fundulus heteroclitus TaxID=8078 RepID=A0A3Q2PX97_FUNHE